MKTLKQKILALVLGSCLFLSACSGPIAYGVGRQQYFDYVPAVVFTAEDIRKLQPIKDAEPDLIAKIEEVHRQWVGMLAERRAAMERAIEINRNQMVDVAKYSKEEANAMIRACLMQHGWPTDDPIYKSLE